MSSLICWKSISEDFNLLWGSEEVIVVERGKIKIAIADEFGSERRNCECMGLADAGKTRGYLYTDPESEKW